MEFDIQTLRSVTESRIRFLSNRIVRLFSASITLSLHPGYKNARIPRSLNRFRHRFKVRMHRALPSGCFSQIGPWWTRMGSFYQFNKLTGLQNALILLLKSIGCAGIRLGSCNPDFTICIHPLIIRATGSSQFVASFLRFQMNKLERR